MNNILDYLAWRGDLTLDQAPFNEIDSLILARLSYLPLDGILQEDFRCGTSIQEAAHAFFNLEHPESRVLMDNDLELLARLADSRRFREKRLCGYRNRLDFAAQSQFCAVTVSLEPERHYVAFRGTDNTLVGWKEDFNMSFLTPVPAQTEAVGYLSEAAGLLPGTFVVGGHSKGGNLAVYAASFCQDAVQRRVEAVFNNDGPGLDQSTLARPGYRQVCSRIRTFVPQSSVVGMMLEHEEEYTIIHSDQTGLMQHDVYSWEVLGPCFISLGQVTNSSRFIDRTLKDWVAVMTPGQREQVIDALFAALEQTDAKTVRQLNSHWFSNAMIVLKSVKNLDEPVRQVVAQTLRELLRAAGKNLNVLVPSDLRQSAGSFLQRHLPAALHRGRGEAGQLQEEHKQ